MNPTPASPRRHTCLAWLLTAIVVTAPFCRAQSTPSTKTGTAADDETLRLPEFKVNTTRDVGYGARDAMGATRMGVELDKTPTTVVVLGEELIRDLGALDPLGALEFVSGMNGASTQYNGQVAIRGFNQNGVTYANGLPQDTTSNGSSLTSMANIDRLEVIKGPQGVLYGSDAAGGVINSVVKRPLANRQLTTKFYAGSWDLYGSTVDATGPVDANKNLLYRAIVSYQRGRTQVAGKNNLTFIAPSATYHLNKTTDVTVDLIYNHTTKSVGINPWFANAGVLSTFLNPKGNFDEFDGVTDQWQYFSTVTLEKRLSDNWRARLVYRQNQIDDNKIGYNKLNYTFVDATGRLLGTVGAGTSNISFANPNWTDIRANRQRKHDLFHKYDHGPYMDIVGSFAVGPTRHKVLASVQYQSIRTLGYEDLAAYPFTSVLNPVHNDYTPAVASRAAAPNVNSRTTNIKEVGSFSDNMSLFSDRLIVQLGYRRDHADTETLNRVNNRTTTLKGGAPSYKAGAVYRPIKGLAFFYNYADTFLLISGADYYGNPYKPQVGLTHEYGAKVDLWDGRWTGTVSFATTRMTNVPETVVIDPVRGITGSLQTGWIQSRGPEADLAFKPIHDVTMLVGWGNTNSLTDRGVSQRNVPIGGNFKALGKYAFNRWPALKGLSVGAGYIHTPRRAGDATSTFFLPPYEKYNAFLILERGRWRWQLNADNLKNSSLAGVSSVNNVYVYAGKPRSYLGSAEYRW